MINSDFKIIIDTREQCPWEFPEHATSKRKLDTGDYSLEGFENILCIERKKNIAEIANNITESRFVDVIDRMSKFKFAFLLIECNYDSLMHYPIGSDVPKKMWNKIKISPGFILKNLMELSVKYNIHIMFCGCPSWAEKTALSIMKRVYDEYKSNN